ncbi:hypothetical protein VPH35_066089 [Triticum aestivum]
MGDGTLVFIRPWRPLAHALGAAMPFRARLVLDGVPAYTWTHSIIERVIGRTCALDVMDERSIFMSDTRDIDLWAWTSSPSRIPKVVWLTFTSRAANGVTISARQPARCLRGATFRIIIHLLRVEDYTSAPLDMEMQDGRQMPYSPPTSVFPTCQRGTIDGHVPVSTDDVVIPGEFDSRGTTTPGAPRGRDSGDGACRELRPRRRDDEGENDDDKLSAHDDRHSGRRHDAAVPRPRSRSPRRRDGQSGGRRDNGGRRHTTDPSPAVGCFRQMGVVVLAEAKGRRVFGGKEADARLALRAVMLREASELRQLIALPAASATTPAGAGSASSPSLEAGTPTPLTVGMEASSDGGACIGVGHALEALCIDDTPPGFGAMPPLSSLKAMNHDGSPSHSPMAMTDPSPERDSPVRTPVATPLPTLALLGP